MTNSMKIILMIIAFAYTALNAQDYGVAFANNVKHEINESEVPYNVSKDLSSTESKFLESVWVDKENATVNFSFKTSIDPNVYMQILDENNRLIYNTSLHSYQGDAIDLSYESHLLRDGNYFVQVQNKDFFISHRVIKKGKNLIVK